jgi:hypothetical protein
LQRLILLPPPTPPPSCRPSFKLLLNLLLSTGSRAVLRQLNPFLCAESATRVLSLAGAALLKGSRQGHLTRCLTLAYEIRTLLRRLRDHAGAPDAELSLDVAADPTFDLLQVSTWDSETRKLTYSQISAFKTHPFQSSTSSESPCARVGPGG